MGEYLPNRKTGMTLLRYKKEQTDKFNCILKVLERQRVKIYRMKNKFPTHVRKDQNPGNINYKY